MASPFVWLSDFEPHVSSPLSGCLTLTRRDTLQVRAVGEGWRRRGADVHERWRRQRRADGDAGAPGVGFGLRKVSESANGGGRTQKNLAVGPLRWPRTYGHRLETQAGHSRVPGVPLVTPTAAPARRPRACRPSVSPLAGHLCPQCRSARPPARRPPACAPVPPHSSATRVCPSAPPLIPRPLAPTRTPPTLPLGAPTVRTKATQDSRMVGSKRARRDESRASRRRTRRARGVLCGGMCSVEGGCGFSCAHIVKVKGVPRGARVDTISHAAPFPTLRGTGESSPRMGLGELGADASRKLGRYRKSRPWLK